MTLEADRERAELERELFTRSLRDFITGGSMRGRDGLPKDGVGPIAGAWDIIEPGNPLDWGWHLDAICEFCEAIAHGEIRDGLIEAPPRYIKSIVATVCFPAWCWAHEPVKGKRILGAQSRWIAPSYSQELAMIQGGKSRTIMQDPWFRDRWGDRVQFATDQNEKRAFANTQRGERHNVGMSGGITGKGADILLVDDPMNADDIHSETYRESIKRTWKEVLPSRLNDQRNGAKLMVAQRLHEDDLPGLFREQGATVLTLPLEYEPKSTCVVPAIGYMDPRELDGELLPGRIDPEARDRLYAANGPFAFNAQYNQRPTPDDENSHFPPDVWARFTDLPRLPSGEYRRPDEVLTSWDLTQEGKTDSDFNVGTLWYRYGVSLFYLLALVRFKGAFVKQREQMRAFDAMARDRFPFPPTKHLVERKASGSSVIDEAKSGIEVVDPSGLTEDQIAALSGLPGVMGFNPDPYGSKVQRIMSTQGLVHAGNVVIPADDCAVADASWVPKWLHEWKSVPTGKYDDQCDSGAQALIYMRRRPKADIR